MNRTTLGIGGATVIGGAFIGLALTLGGATTAQQKEVTRNQDGTISVVTEVTTVAPSLEYLENRKKVYEKGLANSIAECAEAQDSLEAKIAEVADIISQAR